MENRGFYKLLLTIILFGITAAALLYLYLPEKKADGREPEETIMQKPETESSSDEMRNQNVPDPEPELPGSTEETTQAAFPVSEPGESADPEMEGENYDESPWPYEVTITFTNMDELYDRLPLNAFGYLSEYAQQVLSKNDLTEVRELKLLPETITEDTDEEGNKLLVFECQLVEAPEYNLMVTYHYPTKDSMGRGRYQFALHC